MGWDGVWGGTGAESTAGARVTEEGHQAARDRVVPKETGSNVYARMNRHHTHSARGESGSRRRCREHVSELRARVGHPCVARSTE